MLRQERAAARRAAGRRSARRGRREAQQVIEALDAAEPAIEAGGASAVAGRTRRATDAATARVVSAPARLLGLRVQGFKSFAERTLVEFGPGISAVVGPNGSGKSNLADALRWALGEQGRSLRIRKSEDVIWAGSEKRSAQGMADVTLVLDNATGCCPVEYSRARARAAAVPRPARTTTCSTASGSGCATSRTCSTPRASPRTRSCSSARAWSTRRSPSGPRSGGRCSRRSPASGATSAGGARPRTSSTEAEANLARVEDILAELRPQARRLGQLAEQQATRLTAGEELAAALIAAAHGRWHEAAGRAATAEARRDALRRETGPVARGARDRGVGGRRRSRRRWRPAPSSSASGARPTRRPAATLTALGLREARASGEIAAAARDRERIAGERAAAEADLAAHRRDPRGAGAGARPGARGGARRRGPRPRRGAGGAGLAPGGVAGARRRAGRAAPGRGRAGGGGRDRAPRAMPRRTGGPPTSGPRRPRPRHARARWSRRSTDGADRAGRGDRGRGARRSTRARRRGRPPTRAEGTRRAVAERAARAGTMLAGARGRLEQLERRLRRGGGPRDRARRASASAGRASTRTSASSRRCGRRSRRRSASWPGRTSWSAAARRSLVGERGHVVVRERIAAADRVAGRRDGGGAAAARRRARGRRRADGSRTRSAATRTARSGHCSPASSGCRTSTRRSSSRPRCRSAGSR